MKNEQVKVIRLHLSPLETRVYSRLTNQFYEGVTVIELARELFKGYKRKPKSISNSVTSAIRQINRKLAYIGADYRIDGKANGRGGKVVYFKNVK